MGEGVSVAVGGVVGLLVKVGTVVAVGVAHQYQAVMNGLNFTILQIDQLKSRDGNYMNPEVLQKLLHSLALLNHTTTI